ncbi:hypothetical protein D8B26_006737 [Coccidioides posadasii str. Silveira]|nr:hypothetical protein D8B26_006737 [Coccidioides posadasii str. Silveira]
MTALEKMTASFPLGGPSAISKPGPMLPNCNSGRYYSLFKLFSPFWPHLGSIRMRNMGWLFNKAWPWPSAYSTCHQRCHGKIPEASVFEYWYERRNAETGSGILQVGILLRLQRPSLVTQPGGGPCCGVDSCSSAEPWNAQSQTESSLEATNAVGACGALGATFLSHRFPGTAGGTPEVEVVEKRQIMGLDPAETGADRQPGRQRLSLAKDAPPRTELGRV